jgi:hypothetical protein
MVPILYHGGAISPPPPTSCLGPAFQGVLDLCESFVNAEEHDQNFTIDPDSQGPENKQQYPFPHLRPHFRVMTIGSHDYHANSDNKTNKRAYPENDLDDHGGNHGPESPEITHGGLL